MRRVRAARAEARPPDPASATIPPPADPPAMSPFDSPRLIADIGGT
jgi:hypothetical protein